MFIPAYWVFPLDEAGAAATAAALLVAAAAALVEVLVAGVEVRAIVTMVVLGAAGAAAPEPAPGTH